MKIIVDTGACSHHEEHQEEKHHGLIVPVLWPAVGIRALSSIGVPWPPLPQLVHGLVSLSRRAALPHRICRRSLSSSDFIPFTIFTGSL
jgi:hypothetical protein